MTGHGPSLIREPLRSPRCHDEAKYGLAAHTTNEIGNYRPHFIGVGLLDIVTTLNRYLGLVGPSLYDVVQKAA